MTGVILAGGENRRFPTNKCFIEIDGETIIDRNLRMLKRYFKEVFISTNNPGIFYYSKVPLIGDIIDSRGPISGILSCLINSSSEDIFVVACDMPFIKEELVKCIISYRSTYDAIVPVYKSEPQPLIAVYNKKIIELLEKMIKNERKSMRMVLDTINVKYIDEEEVISIDRDGNSFKNINTIEDLGVALK